MAWRNEIQSRIENPSYGVTSTGRARKRTRRAKVLTYVVGFLVAT